MDWLDPAAHSERHGWSVQAHFHSGRYPVLTIIILCTTECVTAVNVAAQDQLTLSISVAVGSTIVGYFFFCLITACWRERMG